MRVRPLMPATRSSHTRPLTLPRFTNLLNNVETEDLRTWALQAAMQFPDVPLEFTASPAWMNRFKKEYRISQRRITKYIEQTERRSFEEIERTAAEFQAEIV